MNEHSVWIEHYESAISLTYDDRYSLVSFVGNKNPNWFPVSRETLEKDSPSFDFTVAKGTLENWCDARLCTQAIKKILRDRSGAWRRSLRAGTVLNHG